MVSARGRYAVTRGRQPLDRTFTLSLPFPLPFHPLSLLPSLLPRLSLAVDRPDTMILDFKDMGIGIVSADFVW